MTTKIELIYQEIATTIETALTDYQRVSNPYELTANGLLMMERAYGIAVGPGIDTQRYVGCLITWERAFQIQIIRQVVTTENNLGIREMIEKEILVDHDLLRKQFYLNSTLGGQAMKSTITDDGGINFIDGDRLKFLAIAMNLLVEYQEDPNT